MFGVILIGSFCNEKISINILKFNPLEQIKGCFSECPLRNDFEFHHKWRCQVALEHSFVDWSCIFHGEISFSELWKSIPNLKSRNGKVDSVKKVKKHKEWILSDFIAVFSCFWIIVLAVGSHLETHVSSDGEHPECYYMNEKQSQQL